MYSIISKLETWNYELGQYDWINDSGDRLSNYTPLQAIIDILDNNIDKKME
jgi:hypothetical protein